MTKASTPTQADFEFLKIPLESTTMVDNGWVLAESISVVSISTLINTGIWWGVCKAPGIASSDSYNLHDIYRIKFNYCDPAAIATRRVYQQSKVLTVKNGLGRLRLFTKIHERVEFSSSTALGIRDKKYL